MSTEVAVQSAAEGALTEVERESAPPASTRSEVSNRMILVKAAYFGTPHDKRLASELDDMLDAVAEHLEAQSRAEDAGHLGRMAEGTILVGSGEPGTRKSSTFQRAFGSRPEFAGFSRDPLANTSCLVSVTAPSPCTLRLLGISVAQALGCTVKPTIKENEAWDLVRRLLMLRGVRFLHIDETQHVTNSKHAGEISKIQNTIKSLVQSPAWPVWLLLTGLPEIERLVEADPQLWRRTRFVRFAELDFERDVAVLRRMFKLFVEERAGLDWRAIDSDDHLHRVMHGSRYRLGVAIDLTLDAIRTAFKGASPFLTREHFALAFERRTGCDPAGNVFGEVDDYTSIDVGRVLTNGQDDKIVRALEPLPAPRKSRRNK